MTLIPKPPSVEGQILAFAKSRPAFTSAQLAAHCSASDWKRTNTLRDLKRRNIIQTCGKHQGQDVMTAFAPDTAMERFLAADLTDECALRFATLETRIKDMEAQDMKPAPAGQWTPSNAQEAALWAYIGDQSRFTKEQFFAHDSLPRHRLELIFRRWQRAGHIRFMERTNATSYFTAIAPEQIQKETRDKRMTPEGRLWSAMRITRTFTPVDLAASLAGLDAQITSQNIQKYCSQLAHYGYLRVLSKASRKAPARYQLIKNTGPLPPVLKRLPVLIDPNTDSIQHAKGA